MSEPQELFEMEWRIASLSEAFSTAFRTWSLKVRRLSIWIPRYLVDKEVECLAVIPWIVREMSWVRAFDVG